MLGYKIQKYENTKIQIKKGQHKYLSSCEATKRWSQVIFAINDIIGREMSNAPNALKLLSFVF